MIMTLFHVQVILIWVDVGIRFSILEQQSPNPAASKSEAMPEPNTKAPGVCFSSDAAPADD